MWKIRLLAWASRGWRTWALFAGIRCFQIIMQGHFEAAVLAGIVFGATWHAAEQAKQLSFDLLAKAGSETGKRLLGAVEEER